MDEYNNNDEQMIDELTDLAADVYDKVNDIHL